MKEEKEFTKKEVAKIFDEILNLGNKPVVHITDRGASYVSSLGIIASLPQNHYRPSESTDSNSEEEITVTRKAA